MNAAPAPAPEMEQAWIQLAAHLAVRESVARAAFAHVVRRYATEARVYHTLEHAWRVAVLRQFLQRPFIYHTPPMRREREQEARANLQAEIERLS